MIELNWIVIDNDSAVSSRNGRILNHCTSDEKYVALFKSGQGYYGENASVIPFSVAVHFQTVSSAAYQKSKTVERAVYVTDKPFCFSHISVQE
jgi:hypothetical protein